LAKNLSTDLRRFARSKPCLARIPGICNFNAETTVLAHARVPGVTGLIVKSNDLAAAHCCSSCHDALDGRTPWPEHLGPKSDYMLAAMVRTIGEVMRYYELLPLAG